MKETLGILVNSSKHPDYVVYLTRAANARQKSVKIHFSGPGVTLANIETVAALSPLARISVCLKSAKEYGKSEMIEKIPDIDLNTPDSLSAIVEGCDRYVVL